MYMFPALSNVIPAGNLRFAAVAGPAVSRKTGHSVAGKRADGEFRNLSERNRWAETHTYQEQAREPGQTTT